MKQSLISPKLITDTEEMEIYELSDKEFRIMLLKKLGEL